MNEDKLPKVVPPLLEKLAEGFSRQNKAATSYWISLAIVSTFTVIPEPIGNMLNVPFLSGLQMSSTSYYPFACILLSLLLLGYASANVQEQDDWFRGTLGMRSRLAVSISSRS